MDERRNERIRRLIASIAGASEDQLRERARRWWPAPVADRDEPAAREWLRRWSPRPAPLLPPACSCASGRCAVCN
jgi:hypothetical protein